MISKIERKTKKKKKKKKKRYKNNLPLDKFNKYDMNKTLLKYLLILCIVIDKNCDLN